MSEKSLEKKISKLRGFITGFSEHVSDKNVIKKFDELIEIYSSTEHLLTLVKTLTHLSPNTFKDKDNLLNLYDFFMKFSDHNKEDCPKLFYLVQDCDRANDYLTRDEYVPNLINPILLEYKDSDNLISVVESFWHRELTYLSCDDIKIQNTLLLYSKELPETEFCNEKVFLNFMSGYSDNFSQNYNLLRVTHKLINNFKEEKEFIDLVAFLSNTVLENVEEDIFKAGRSYVNVLKDFVKKYLENTTLDKNLLKMYDLPPICEHLSSMDFIKSNKTIYALTNTFDIVTHSFTNDSDLLQGIVDNFYFQLNNLIESEYSKENSHYEVEGAINNWLNSLSQNNSLYHFYLLPNIKKSGLKLDLSEREINKLGELYLFVRNSLVSFEDYSNNESNNNVKYHQQLDTLLVQSVKECSDQCDNIQNKRDMIYDWSNNVMKSVREKPELLFEYFSLRGASNG